MRVYITGLIIPHTNMWEIEETWTARKLVGDVISLVSSKQQDGTGYFLYLEDEKIDDDVILCDNYPPETEFTIRGN